MANSKQLHRLNALKVSKETAPGYHADGGGLYLQISASGSRSWIFRFSLAKRAREMGLCRWCRWPKLGRSPRTVESWLPKVLIRSRRATQIANASQWQVQKT